MRKTILEKDDFFELGSENKKIYMDADAVELNEGTLPLSYNYNHEKLLLGKVFDIRVEDGRITGEVEFFNEADALVMDEVHWTLGGYYSDVKYADAEKTRVGSAVLRAVSVVPVSMIGGVRWSGTRE